MTNHNHKSIVDQLRTEGFRQGYGQASMSSYDHAFYEGQQAAWKNVPSRALWYLCGFLTTPLCVLVAWWVW